MNSRKKREQIRIGSCSMIFFKMIFRILTALKKHKTISSHSIYAITIGRGIGTGSQSRKSSEKLQVAITIGTGTGKWATWAICFIFVINSAANCVMLLLFSPSLR